MSKVLYRPLERDLTALVNKRVSDAIASVLQLADSPAQAYVIATAAGNTAVAVWAGAMAEHYGRSVEEINTPDMLEAFASVMRETT